MIEAIITLVIIAILIAVVISRISATTQAALSANVAKLKVHLRYAQLRAFNSTERVWGVYFPDDNTSSYRLFYVLASDNSVNYMAFPGENTDPVILPDTAIAIDGGTRIVSFDAWGKPYQNQKANFVSPIPQTIDLRTITLTTDEISATITIRRNTGYIP
jgi:type II secretory pathway pseudopilin PulG